MFGSVNGSTGLTVTRPTFVQVGSLITTRVYHTATRLPNGKVLIVGGQGDSGILSSVELYDPSTGLFTPTGNLAIARYIHTATLLNSGKVLIAGGLWDSGSGFVSVANAELYDPESGTFSYAGTLRTARAFHAATLLKTGMVLIVGGHYNYQGGGADALTAELYDPGTGTFSNTGSLAIARYSPTATLLNDGTVLVTGGADYAVNDVRVTERYNPETGTFTLGGNFLAQRLDPTATLLANGAVLVAGGGCNACSPNVFASAETYDPSTSAFAASGGLSVGRAGHTSTPLNDGSVLVVGGNSSDGSTGTAELYNPATQTFTGAGSLTLPRVGHTATILNDGNVLIAGGTDGFVSLAIAELYAPTPPPPSSLQVTPSMVNMAVGETRQFTVIDNTGHPRSDAIWTLSDNSLATITADSSPTLTAVAAGNLTLTATVGSVSAQAQIAISPIGTVFPPGTMIWSLPSTPGFAPLQIAQAIPTDSGPDLYSAETSADGKVTTIHALTADGQQMWQAQLPAITNKSVPDAFGGLLVTEHATCDTGQTDPMTVADIDSVTGQQLWRVTAAGIQFGQTIVYCYSPNVAPQIAIRPDGWVIMSSPTNAGFPPLMEVWKGAVYTEPIPESSFTDAFGVVHYVQSIMGPPIVDSDGSTYVEYQVRDSGQTRVNSAVLYLLKIGADWVRTTTQLMSNTELNSGRFPEPTDSSLLPGRVIPDGQGGVLATWTISPSNMPFPPQLWHYYQAVRVVGGNVVASYDLPFTPLDPVLNKYPTLVLGENSTAFASGLSAAPDGSAYDLQQIMSFNLSTGAPNWRYPAVTQQSTLTILAVASDGAITINDSQAGVLRLDSSGNPSQLSGNLGAAPRYSWSENWYLEGPQGTSRVVLPIDVDPAGIWATEDGSPSQNGGANALCECLVQTSDPIQGQSPEGSPPKAGIEDSAILAQAESIPNCPICDLAPPVPPATKNCTTLAGSGQTYLILIGDPGQPPHNVGNNFNLAAQQNANDLQAQGNKVIACRVSSVQDFNNALIANGLIGGSLIYYGHSGPYNFRDENGNVTAKISILAVGQGTGLDTNIGYYNVDKLCASQQGCNIANVLGSNASIMLYGCSTKADVAGLFTGPDPSGITRTPIAKLLARQLRRGVYGYKVGTYFSRSDASRATSSDYRGEPKRFAERLPLYLIPVGAPGHKPKPELPFLP